MITAALLVKMANDIEELEIDTNAFWEELPLQADGKPAQGVWIVTRGGTQSNNSKGINQRITADIYVAKANKIETEATQAKIANWITANAGICDLSGVIGGTPFSYTNVRLRPATTPSNQGITENGNIVKLASAEVYYDINQ